jgi:DNA-directed RNA polymerase specialized sigma24 family protein
LDTTVHKAERESQEHSPQPCGEIEHHDHPFDDRLQSRRGRRALYESRIEFVTASRDAGQLGRIDASRAHEVGNLFGRVQVSEAFNQLLPSHREVIRKAYYLGWTTGQIAADLNVTEAVIKSRLHYGLHTLRLLIDPTMPSP